MLFNKTLAIVGKFLPTLATGLVTLAIIAVIYAVYKKIASGSRKTYFLKFDRVENTTKSLRTREERVYETGDDSVVIEIDRRPFQRQSEIHSTHPITWVLAQEWEENGANFVQLQDGRGLPIESAVRLVNSHDSFQGLLDTNASLEHNLAVANAQRLEWRAIITAVIQMMEEERFRSIPSQHARECLIAANKYMDRRGESAPDPQRVEAWLKILSVNKRIRDIEHV